MSKLENTNLKRDIYKGELIRIDYLSGDDYKERLLLAGEKLEKLRI